jgi:hypothetical protein
MSKYFRSNEDSRAARGWQSPHILPDIDYDRDNIPPIARPIEVVTPFIQVAGVAETYEDTNSPRSCTTCTAIIDRTELPISVAELVKSSSQACSICTMFVNVLGVSPGTLGAYEISSWRDTAGGYGLYVVRNPLETDNDNGPIERVPDVIVLAADGGELSNCHISPLLTSVQKEAIHRSAGCLLSKSHRTLEVRRETCIWSTNG